MADAAQFAAILTDVLWDADADGQLDAQFAWPIQSISTFEDAGLLTRDDGIIVKLADGAEYQLTVRKSR